MPPTIPNESIFSPQVTVGGFVIGAMIIAFVFKRRFAARKQASRKVRLGNGDESAVWEMEMNDAAFEASESPKNGRTHSIPDSLD